MLVCTLHWYQRPGHLEVVAREMERLGPPRLRGYLDPESGAFLLREGTHRINAAHLLGLAPVLVPALVLVRVPWWRSKKSLASARVAAQVRGLHFDRYTLA